MLCVSPKTDEPIPGARLLLELLKRHGVQVIFGYPGGAVIPIYDALHDFPDIRHILVRHEQGAAHMADGFARASGKVGACMTTSGPGATNLVTGLATAYMDSVPVIAITGQVKSHLIGNDAFQEADVTGVTRPVTKHNYLVKKLADLPRLVKEAFHIATTGRPGPVLIDFPVDFQREVYRGPINVEADLPGYKPPAEPDPDALAAAAEALNRAERPLLYVGGGCISAGAHRELREVAERADAPVTLTLMGLGAFPGDHPLCLGMLGMHGTSYANFAVDNCDLLVSMGARFDDRITGKLDTFAVRARKVHFDIDPICINKNIRADVPVLGDLRKGLKALYKHLKPRERKDWLAPINKVRAEHPLRYPKDGLHAQYVIDRICRATQSKAVVTADVGQHQMWTAQFYTFLEPRQFLSSGGLGTMGFGMPAAIGAQVARPEAEVWCIAGDGSIMMNIQELVTAHRLKVPIKIAIMNNSHLGMVRQWQEMFWDKRYSEVDLSDNPDFAKVAEAFGCHGLTCTERAKVDATIEQARKLHDAPVVINFLVERAANVYPMVPAGASLDEILYYPKEPELI